MYLYYIFVHFISFAGLVYADSDLQLDLHALGFEIQLLVEGYWVLDDFACKVVVFVSEFGDSVHNSSMGFEHYCNTVVEKLWDSENYLV